MERKSDNDDALGINWMNRDSVNIPIQEGEPDAIGRERKAIMQMIRQIRNNRVTPSANDFMEVSKDLKSVKIENGQIVIEREISDGTIHKGGNGTALAGGYTSGMQKDVIRVNLSQMGSVLKNPKDLFSEWTNKDYNDVADNLDKAATNLYASAEKDSKAVTSGIMDSVKRGEQFLELAMGRAESAIKQEELVKDVAIAYLTGGAAGIKSMVKDKIRDGFIEKAAEATGMDPQLVRFALGRFEQGQAAKKVAANRVSTTVAGVAAVGVSVMLPMAAPMMSSVLSRVGATAAQSLLSTAVASSGTIGVMGARTVIAANTYNNPLTQAVVGLGGAVTGSSGLVQSSNRLNELKQQERGLIQDAVGATVASAMGLPPDAAGNISQVLGGIAKRREQKKNNVKLDRVVSSGLATVTNMASGMVKGIVRNAVVAVGGSGSTFDQVTSSPFSAAPTWTGAAPVDTSKAGLINRVQEYAVGQFLEANGMDAELAGVVASTANGKIKAKKARRAERTNAIESTVQTGIAVTAMAITAGAAAPLISALGTTTQTATMAVNVASTVASTAIGSRTGGAQGAIAGLVNGVISSVAPIKVDGLPVSLNVSYDRKNGWGGGIGVGGSSGNLSVNASQRGGAQVSYGNRFGSLNYDTSNGTYGANVNVGSFFGDSKNSFVSGVLSSLGPNVGWNSETGASAGVSLDLQVSDSNNPARNNTLGSIGLNFDRNGSNITGDVDNTNLFTSSSDGSFQVNRNFANERLTNNQINQAQAGFDAEMERREREAGNTAIRGAKPPLNNDPSTMSPEAREAALRRIGHEMAANGTNEADGTSRITDTDHIIGEIADGIQNIGATVGIGSQASSASGFVDDKGNFHPRTCFTKGTLVTKLKARYYEDARNGGLTPDGKYEEKVAIETIKAGDYVLSFDEVKKEKSYKKVTDTFVRTTDLIYTVSFVNGEKLETTWNHPFWVLKKSVVRESGQVELGASLVAARFIDSDSLSGENNSSLDGEWISAKDLKAGDVSLTAGGKRLLIASITSSSQSETVYNFSVADNHTYFVGVDGVLVHNEAYLIYVPESGESPEIGVENLGHTAVVTITKDKKAQLIEFGPYGRNTVDEDPDYSDSKHKSVVKIKDVEKLGITNLQYDKSGKLTPESEKRIIQGIMENKYRDLPGYSAKVVHLKDVDGDAVLLQARIKAQQYEDRPIPSYSALFNNCTTVACSILNSGGLKQGGSYYVNPTSLYNDLARGNTNRVMQYRRYGNEVSYTEIRNLETGSCGVNMSCPKTPNPACGNTMSCPNN